MTSGDGLRVGDAERDETTAALREHYAQGRLTREELDERLDQALNARTARDLAEVCADLPSYGVSPPSRRPATGYREPGEHGHDWEHEPWQVAILAQREHLHRLRQAHHEMRRAAHREMRAARHGGWPGHHHGWAGRRRGRGPGPLAPILLIALIAGVAVGGFAVLKVLFFVWLAGMLFGALHRRHHLRRTGS
ncbi:DUF1707 domain-containing protein [Nonomuraea sp. NPDC046570]|uniref:DUF1707 SHOCT-like domain-containing protein n=1 Tax=Nonomuraea sp. NPDC046570 TaxID=3155255 RepID=UPI0033CFE931